MAWARCSPVVLHGGRVPSFEHNVEAVAQSPLGLRRIEVEGGDHALLRLSVADRLEDRVVPEGWVAGEVHLGYEAAPERLPEEGEVDGGGAAGVVVVLPRVGAW